MTKREAGLEKGDAKMNELPLVSVVIPVYNGEKFIGQCIESILCQEYPNKEVLVVDDGSTDQTEKVVNAFGNRIRYIKQKNSGSAVARNRGIDESNGKYVAFNDGDDLWAPNRLREQVHFLDTHPDFGVAVGKFQHVDASFCLDNATPVDDSRAVKIDWSRSGWVYHTLFETSRYHIIAALVRRELLTEQIRFEPDFRRGQDYDFWLQLANHCQIAQLDKVYAYYRKNEESISHKPHLRNYRAEIMASALERFGSASKDGRTATDKHLNDVFYKVWFEYGYELYLAQWYKRSLIAFMKAWKFGPTKLGSYKFILRCLLLLFRDKSPA